MSDRPRAAARLAEIDDFEVTVEKLVAGGEGLARFEGIPIFVPRSAPGDRLRVRLTERRPDYGRAEIVEILTPGPGRREPPCPVYERCGGCDLQHLEDARQVELKAMAVRETLERVGHVRLPKDTRIVVGAMWGYRRRAQLHTEGGDDGLRIGYRARGSHDLVATDRCPILVPALEELLPQLPRVLGAEGPRRLDLLAGDHELSVAPVVAGLPHGEVAIQVGELEYRLDARSFFQSHAGLTPQLVEIAVGEWSGETAADLYSGVGLFTLPLSRRYRRVLAVEGDRVAARQAARNCRRLAAKGVEGVSRAVETWVDGLPTGLDRVLVDPPRAGLAAPVRQALIDRPPRRLTYVSCHPATLARDLKALAGTYAIESAALLDLFPQSGHMEVVVQLVAS